MATFTQSFTSSGSEIAGYTIGTWPFPAFTGPFSISIGASPASTSIVRFGINFFKTGTTCHSEELVFVSGDTAKSMSGTVGTPTGGGGWACTDWTSLNWYIGGPTSSPGAGIVWTLTVTGAFATDAFINYKLTLDTSASGTDSRYQLLSEKNQANGYAGLDANVRVPTARLGSGTASSSTYLRGDQSWATPAGGGGGTPTLLLDYVATTTLANNVSIPTGTWTDIPGTSQTFTVTNASAPIEFRFGGSWSGNSASSTARAYILLRLSIDSGATVRSICGGCSVPDHSHAVNILSGVTPVLVSSLTAASHTVKLQGQAVEQNMNIFMQAGSFVRDAFTMQVIQYG